MIMQKSAPPAFLTTDLCILYLKNVKEYKTSLKKNAKKKKLKKSVTLINDKKNYNMT